MKRLIAVLLTASIVGSNFAPTINAYANSIKEEKSKATKTLQEASTTGEVIEVRTVDELQNAIDNAKDGTIIKVYPGTYEISNIEVNNKGSMTIKGCDENGDEIENLNYSPYIYGSLTVKNQNGLNIIGLKVKNLEVTSSSNINIKNCGINDWFKLNGAVNDTIVESTVANNHIMVSGTRNVTFRDFNGYSMNIGSSDYLLIENSKVSNMYLGNTSYNYGSKNTTIENSNISSLRMGYNGKAQDTNIISSSIGDAYIGYDGGNVSNTTIEDSQIKNRLSIGYKGIAENTVIKNCNIKGKLSIGTYSGIARNTKISDNTYEKGSTSNDQGISLGEQGGLSDGTTIVNTADDVIISGGIKLDVAKNTLLIGDNLSYTTTDNTLKLIKINEIKEPANILKGTGYKDARIEVKSSENTVLDEVLIKDGEFELNLDSKVEDNNLVSINIYDTNGNLLNSAELVSDIRLEIPISTKEELNEVRNNLYKNYYLTQDIEFTEADFKEGGAFYNNGKGWTPIGESKSKPFKGKFDGKGYEIKGLKVSGVQYAGLFGCNEGVIKNLGMVDGEINANSNSNENYAGAIAAYNTRTIENCYSSSKVTADSSSGMSYEYVGGIVGNNFGGSIYNSYNEGQVSVDSSSYWTYIGGIAGQSRGYISQCYNLGDVESEKVTNSNSAYVYIGGIVGGNYSGGSITKSYNNGNIKGYCEAENYPEVAAGGIAGSNIYSISDSFNIGSIDAHTEGRTERTYVGGIAGSNRTSIDSCYTLGTIKYNGSNIDDRVVGHTEYGSSDRVTNCYSVTKDLSREEFLKKETYKGFDFESTWTMEGNKNYLYPELQNVNMVFKKALIEVKISNEPTKKSYIEGEDLDISGLEVKAIYNNGEEEVITDYEVSGYDSNVGKKVVTVTYQGKTDTFEVNVTANTAPVINVKNTSIKAYLPFDPKSIATATDKEDGDITDKIEIVKDDVDINNVGRYEVTYKVVDKHGLSTTKTIYVTVVSNEKPVINLEDISIKKYDYFNEMDNVSAYDNEDGNLTGYITVEGYVDRFTPGVYTLVYKVTDRDGNETIKERKVTVNEVMTGLNNVPTITAKDITLNVGDKFDPYKDVTAFDKEDEDLTSLIQIVEYSVNVSKPGTYKITYKVQDRDGATSTKSRTVTVRKVFVEFVVNNIHSKSVEITGKGESGATVQAYVGNTALGKAVTVSSSGSYKISIPAQKANTTITVKMTKSGYQTAQKSIKVIGIVSGYKKNLTTDIYRYDAGKGNHLTYINGKGYSQYVYLNRDEKYAFTPSSWMVAAGLTVSMPTEKNGYTMTIDNPYKTLVSDANALLDKINNPGKYSTKEIKAELQRLESKEENLNTITSEVNEDMVVSRAVPKKTLTKDIYRYDLGKGKHLTYINGKGYSQYSYLNQDGRYAFTPSSWMVAAGLIVDMPSPRNGYRMTIDNPYIYEYKSKMEEIKSYI